MTVDTDWAAVTGCTQGSANLDNAALRGAVLEVARDAIPDAVGTQTPQGTKVCPGAADSLRLARRSGGRSQR
jgi:hypothetical protein